jgi:hypothetical protein
VKTEDSTLNGDNGTCRPLAWTGLDATLTLVWAAGIWIATILWNQWAMGLSDPWAQQQLEGLAFILLGVPVVFGALGGLLIHRKGGWIDALILAAIGAACLGLGALAAWTIDPRACTPEPGTDCDLGYGFGALIVSVVAFVPFLAGSALGRSVALVLRRRPTR